MTKIATKKETKENISSRLDWATSLLNKHRAPGATIDHKRDAIDFNEVIEQAERLQAKIDSIREDSLVLDPEEYQKALDLSREKGYESASIILKQKIEFTGYVNELQEKIVNLQQVNKENHFNLMDKECLACAKSFNSHHLTESSLTVFIDSLVTVESDRTLKKVLDLMDETIKKLFKEQ